MEFKFTDEQFAKILDESRQEITESMIKGVKQHLTWSVKDVLTKELEPIVRKFCQEEIVPEVVESLAGSKSAIVAAVVAKSEEVGFVFAESLAKSVAKNLGEPYRQKAIFEALFR